ncbi:FAD:protein FMN transferase [Crocinitomicaceae bacterium]|nr:FAD:protein FMN transferase [Crocinitomicaceae bacterium]
MFGTLKLKALIWSVIFSILTLVSSCDEAPLPTTEITGQTQGTNYTVIVVGDQVEIKKSEIDRILREFDLSLSTYIEESIISKLNESVNPISLTDKSGFFKTCYEESQDVYSRTGGLFDPSVYPLVKGWGFMNDMETPLDQHDVDSLLQFIGFEPQNLHAVSFSDSIVSMTKFEPRFKIDFNAIAQGLSVDVLYDFIKEKGYENFFVEIGGELRVSGKNKYNTSWNIAIDRPIDGLQSRQLDTIVHITNKAIATSGNYRKFYVKDGVKYSHTLNPKTGTPVNHTLLSATVIADKCSSADAYATAFMVMGRDATLQFVRQNENLNLDVYLIYTDASGELKHSMSSRFSPYLE